MSGMLDAVASVLGYWSSLDMIEQQKRYARRFVTYKCGPWYFRGDGTPIIDKGTGNS